MPDLTSEEIAATTREFAESVSIPKVKALLLEVAQYQERATKEGEPQERTDTRPRDPRFRRYRPGKSLREKKARGNFPKDQSIG